MKNSIISYPRIGANRELKFAIEKYFKNESSKEELLQSAKHLRAKHYKDVQDWGIDFIPSNDFSLYDHVLDAAVLFNIIPKRYKHLNLDPLDEYFAQARGYQGKNGDTLALAMKKWFNTNYHYLVPECDDANTIALKGDKIFKEYFEAKELNIETKPVLIGIFTLFKLISFKDTNTKELAKDKLLQAYIELFKKLNSCKIRFLQLDEPYLVYDLHEKDMVLFEEFYKELLGHKGGIKVLLQSYFGDLRDIYAKLLQSDFDALGIDFVEGKESLHLIKKYGFAKDKTLFAGIISGKNIYANDYAKSLKLIKELQKYTQNIVLNTSCSLLHVPYSKEFETKLDSNYLKLFSFTKEKLKELRDLKEILNSSEENSLLSSNEKLFKNIPNRLDPRVKARLSSLKKKTS